MNAKYLLYIDILGFAAIAGSDSERVMRLYSIIDSLNVHRHDGFRTIVFSDTILVYNDFTPRDEHEHEYAVMFQCEFAQDLLVRLVGQDVYFRALLDYGEFSHDRLTNIESFFGPALVRSYQREKQLQAVGLFATAACVARNRVFPTERFQEDLYFVFLNQSLERLQVPVAVRPNLRWQHGRLLPHSVGPVLSGLRSPTHAGTSRATSPGEAPGYIRSVSATLSPLAGGV